MRTASASWLYFTAFGVVCQGLFADFLPIFRQTFTIFSLPWHTASIFARPFGFGRGARLAPAALLLLLSQGRDRAFNGTPHPRRSNQPRGRGGACSSRRFSYEVIHLIHRFAVPLPPLGKALIVLGWLGFSGGATLAGFREEQAPPLPIDDVICAFKSYRNDVFFSTLVPAGSFHRFAVPLPPGGRH